MQDMPAHAWTASSRWVRLPLLMSLCTLLAHGAASQAAESLPALPSPRDTIAAVHFDQVASAEETAFGESFVSDALAEVDVDMEILPPADVVPASFHSPVAWWNPWCWFAGPCWERGFEVGINGSEGNAQAFSILTSGKLKRTSETSTWGIDVVYGKTEANSVLTQHYAFLNSRYDYHLGEGRWSLFNITRLEYDQFKTFDLRLALNGGLGYDILQSERQKLTGRFGAGASREFGGLDDDWVPEAVFGADYEVQLSEKQKVSITTDYYPAWDDFADYRLVTQASWEILLDEATNLSLKVGLLDRYDSTPMGNRPNDVDYFITLLWKI